MVALAILALTNFNCTSDSSDEKGIITGADQTEKYLSYFKGKRIGLVANQTSIIGKKSSVDSLKSLGVNIVKVFGPCIGARLPSIFS